MAPAMTDHVCSADRSKTHRPSSDRHRHIAIPDRNDAAGKATFVSRAPGRFLPFHGQRIHIIAGLSAQDCDQIGRDPLRHRFARDGDAAIGQYRHTAHHFDAASPASPLAILPAALAQASSPEAQKRLTCTLGTDST
nr:hypothetical protein [Citreicella sp. C3M06]